MALLDVFAPFEDFGGVRVIPDIVFTIVDAKGDGFVTHLILDIKLNARHVPVCLPVIVIRFAQTQSNNDQQVAPVYYIVRNGFRAA